MSAIVLTDRPHVAAFGAACVAAAGDLVFSAPCRPSDPETGALASSVSDQTKAAVQNAIAAIQEASAGIEDITRIRLWVSSHAKADEVESALLELFPHRASRPAVSLIAADLDAPVHVLAEVFAVRGGVRRSIYRNKGNSGEFPGGCMKGRYLCTSNLAGAEGPAADGSIDAPDVQARKAFEQLDEVLAQAEVAHWSVAHMMVWYKDHSFRDVVNAPFVERYPTLGDRPARHSLVRDLPTGVGVQLEAIAVAGQRRFTYAVPGCFHLGIQQIPNSLPFATRVGTLMQTAATYGHILDDGSKGGDIDEQCEIAFQHSIGGLNSAGLSLKDVTHVYVWLADRTFSEAVSRAWSRHFGEGSSGPVRHDIVSSLPVLPTGPFLVQIELTAVSTSHHVRIPHAVNSVNAGEEQK
jgi:2-iminobutanoate/2-iminopropanoate deaminase